MFIECNKLDWNDFERVKWWNPKPKVSFRCRIKINRYRSHRVPIENCIKILNQGPGRQSNNTHIFILLSLRNIQVSFLVLSFIILWHSLVYFIAGYDWRPRSTGHLEGWRDITATCHPSNVETCLPGQPTPPFRHGYRGWYLWNQTRFAKDFGRTATSEIRQDLRRIFSTLRECHKMIQERT